MINLLYRVNPAIKELFTNKSYANKTIIVVHSQGAWTICIAR
jgi:hypothetical protein